MHSYRYRITIEGHLGKAGCAAFEEFSIASGNGHTSLVADLDQSALYGALIRIQSLVSNSGSLRGYQAMGADRRRRARRCDRALPSPLLRTWLLPDLVTDGSVKPVFACP